MAIAISASNLQQFPQFLFRSLNEPPDHPAPRPSDRAFETPAGPVLRGLGAVPRTETLGDELNLGTPTGSEGAVVQFSSQVTQLSLSAMLQEVRARLAQAADEGGAPSAELVAQQLTFDFFAEARTEQLVLFQQRTDAVAAGLDGARQETFIEASRRVSARFSVSINVSGAVLNGFANAAEGLQDSDPATFDKLLGFANDALDKADEILNKMFELLDAFFQGTEELQARIDEFIENLRNLGALPEGEQGGEGATNATQIQFFQFSLQLEFNFEYSEEVQITQGEVQKSDPITLDLDGDGIELTSYQLGARFDITGKGQLVKTAFVTGGDAFLALDRNANGVVDSGLELFGDQRGAINGYEELRKLDSNGDGMLDAKDTDFDKLLLFRDNGNGKTEPGELVSLADAGIVALSLGYTNVDQAASGGNRIAQVASYYRKDGTLGRAADTILNFIA
ncbi:MAG: hypothetical protein HY706_10260 [Candidatus Hydrogenedentes bacterium]|nr:hypothetical protein [Candidatus Hydrogenedentota bacterium]